MIKIHLSRIMGEKRLTISDVARDTGVDRGTITRLYHENAERIELSVLNDLCGYLGCEIDGLIQYIPDQESPGLSQQETPPAGRTKTQ